MVRALMMVPLLLSACVSSARVKGLEKRIVEMEEREAKREVEINGTLMRIEAQLAALAAGYARIGDVGGDDLLKKLAEIEERLDRVPPRPTPRPTRPAPDPKSVYAVQVAGAPFRGNRDALVTIVRAGEYACPFCEKSRPTMDEILRLYGSKVRIVHLNFVVHPQLATEAARAGCAAHRQGKFWEMDDLLWEQVFKTRQFEAAHIESLAANLGLDMDRFRTDVNGVCVSQIQQDIAHLSALGVGATPAFFINGRFLSGAQPLPTFQTLIDEELALAQTRVKKGTKAKRYYEEWVVQKGLTRLAPPPAGP
jgi:protein-disulfide isomerase